MWDATPGHATPGHATPATPGKKNRWDETPHWGETPRADRGERIKSFCQLRNKPAMKILKPLVLQLVSDLQCVVQV